MKRIKERRGNEIVQNMTSNFAKETNQRDEDAEMQKFIEEQLRLRKEAEKEIEKKTSSANFEPSVEETKKFKKPEDALFDVPKYLIENKSKHKSEESMSEQMLSGIPEVDLGVEERIRNIEETERTKNTLNKGRQPKRDPNSHYAPHNQSVNFVQHKRFDDTLINPDHMIKPRMPRPGTGQTVKTEPQPVVGDAPKHKLLQQGSVAGQKHFIPSRKKKPFVNAIVVKSSTEKPVEGATEGQSSDAASKPVSQKRPHASGNPGTMEKATDDYCLERFKKNMRFSRNSKIKIC